MLKKHEVEVGLQIQAGAIWCNHTGTIEVTTFQGGLVSEVSAWRLAGNLIAFISFT